MKRFLLISDIHACDVDPTSSGAPSYVSTFPRAGTDTDPFSELERLIAEEKLSIDFILCPGDITNKASKAPFSYAWEKLNTLANTINSGLISTVGNHDVDSRYTNNTYDPSEFVKSLMPRLPTNDVGLFRAFWSENFCLVTSDECNILALNTAAYHGGGKDVCAEMEYGRISPTTLIAIKNALRDVPVRPTNILLCHHHVLRSDISDVSAKGVTRGGDTLVDVLNDRPEAWIIVHGHRHVPELIYGHGGSNSPTIVGCASFSAQINFDAQNKNPNQVHLLTSDPAAAARSGWVSTGEIRSWTWQPGIGWKKARGPQGLNHVTGFGFRSSVAFLANQIDQHLKSQGKEHISWSEALLAHPQLSWLIPSDFRALEAALAKQRITILLDRDGSYAQIGRSS